MKQILNHFIHTIKLFLSEERGNVMVLVAFSMVALIGISGLVTDMGMVYLQESNLKKEATTAVLSGAQELVNTDPAQLALDEQRVRTVVDQTLSSYNAGSQLTNLQINMNHEVSVGLAKNVPFAFSKLFGFNQMNVQEQAGATIEPVGSMRGVVPLGIDASLPITYGQVTSLKVGAGDATTGVYGIIAIEGSGASSYLDTLEHGTVDSVKVGETYDFKTGNVDGDTQVGVQYRLDNSPYPEGETFHRNDPRVMPIVVYNTLPSKQLQVVGFAYFYLLAPGSDPSVIRGMFIKRVGQGSFGSGAVDRGAYIAKLVE